MTIKIGFTNSDNLWEIGRSENGKLKDYLIFPSKDVYTSYRDTFLDATQEGRSNIFEELKKNGSKLFITYKSY